jgi:hypothetical protein
MATKPLDPRGIIVRRAIIRGVKPGQTLTQLGRGQDLLGEVSRPTGISGQLAHLLCCVLRPLRVFHERAAEVMFTSVVS